MRNIIAIAVSTYKEILRNKIFYIAIAFCVGLMASTLLYNMLAIGQEVSFVKNMGLATIQILGMLIATFGGANLITKEMDTRTVQLIFAKPVKKDDFVLGKFFGGMGIILVNMFFMTVAILLIMLVWTRQFNFELLKAIVPMTFEFAILLSLAMLISIFGGSLLSAIFTICIFLVGHVTTLLPYAIDKSSNIVVKVILWVVYYALPNLTHFSLKNQVVNGMYIPASLLMGILLYGVVYCSMVLIVSMLSFRTKELA